LRQTEEALVALEADVEATAQIIASNATMLLERAAHTQGQLEECIAHTATTQQSVSLHDDILAPYIVLPVRSLQSLVFVAAGVFRWPK